MTTYNLTIVSDAENIALTVDSEARVATLFSRVPQPVSPIVVSGFRYNGALLQPTRSFKEALGNPTTTDFNILQVDSEPVTVEVYDAVGTLPHQIVTTREGGGTALYSSKITRDTFFYELMLDVPSAPAGWVITGYALTYSGGVADIDLNSPLSSVLDYIVDNVLTIYAVYDNYGASQVSLTLEMGEGDTQHLAVPYGSYFAETKEIADAMKKYGDIDSWKDASGVVYNAYSQFTQQTTLTATHALATNPAVATVYNVKNASGAWLAQTDNKPAGTLVPSKIIQNGALTGLPIAFPAQATTQIRSDVTQGLSELQFTIHTAKWLTLASKKWNFTTHSFEDVARSILPVPYDGADSVIELLPYDTTIVKDESVKLNFTKDNISITWTNGTDTENKIISDNLTGLQESFTMNKTIGTKSYTLEWVYDEANGVAKIVLPKFPMEKGLAYMTGWDMFTAFDVLGITAKIVPVEVYAYFKSRKDGRPLTPANMLIDPEIFEAVYEPLVAPTIVTITANGSNETIKANWGDLVKAPTISGAIQGKVLSGWETFDKAPYVDGSLWGAVYMRTFYTIHPRYNDLPDSDDAVAGFNQQYNGNGGMFYTGTPAEVGSEVIYAPLQNANTVVDLGIKRKNYSIMGGSFNRSIRGLLMPSTKLTGKQPVFAIWSRDTGTLSSFVRSFELVDLDTVRLGEDEMISYNLTDRDNVYISEPDGFGQTFSMDLTTINSGWSTMDNYVLESNDINFTIMYHGYSEYTRLHKWLQTHDKLALRVINREAEVEYVVVALSSKTKTEMSRDSKEWLVEEITFTRLSPNLHLTFFSSGALHSTVTVNSRAYVDIESRGYNVTEMEFIATQVDGKVSLKETINSNKIGSNTMHYSTVPGSEAYEALLKNTSDGTVYNSINLMPDMDLWTSQPIILPSGEWAFQANGGAVETWDFTTDTFTQQRAEGVTWALLSKSSQLYGVIFDEA